MTSGYSVCEAEYHLGQRWLPVPFFALYTWDTQEGEKEALSTICKTCIRRRSYVHWRAVEALTKELGRYPTEREIKFRIHHKLPAEEFIMWLQGKIQELGVPNIASAVGCDGRLVHTYASGRYTKKGTLYKIKYVQAATVHEFTRALGEYPEDLYPELG